MKTPVALLMSFLIAPAAADVYKTIGPNGEVIYSDQPQLGSKAITLPPATTYTPSPPPPSSAKPAPVMEDATNEYRHFAIASPANEDTIRDNTGMLTVTLDLQPALDTTAGHGIVYVLDGKPMEGRYQTGGAVLNNINRGAHTLAAQVVNAKGQPLISTDPIRFYMHRESALHPPAGASKPKPQPRSFLERLFGIEPGPVVVRNPGHRSDNPNVLSQNPNHLTDTPNQPGSGLPGAKPAPTQ